MPTISDEILSKALAFAQANGFDLGLSPEGSEAPDERPIFPAVNLNRAVSEIAHETGLNLKSSGLYLYNERLVLITPEGKDEEMDDVLFRSWIDSFQLNYSKRRKKSDDDEGPGEPIKATMKADTAKVLLKSHEFRCHIPKIRRILPVRLPVRAKGQGDSGIRVLPFGYDPETQIYTCDTGIRYDLDWEKERGVQYLRDLVKEFPYGDSGRSIAVQISAMLTTYCQLLFGELDRWPMIYYNANQPGSGKSRLAELCIYAIYGAAEPLNYSDNDEFVKKLDTWARNGLAYTFLDDVSGLVKNNDLNRWLTSPTWAGRVMHHQTMFSVVNQTLTLLTGNQATLSDDLGRRMLMVDLWSSELPSDRQGRLSRVIDAEWLATPTNRQDILSALFSLVRNWDECAEGDYEKLIPSFEAWSRLIPSVVTLAGFECPLQPPNVEDAGQKQAVEFQRLIEAAVEVFKPTLGKPVDQPLAEWCMLARWKGLFHSMISDADTMAELMDASHNGKLWKMVDDPKSNITRAPVGEERRAQSHRYMDKSMSTKFSGMLHRFYRGQIRVVDGKRYKFADRKARYSTFVLEMLPDEAAAGA